MKQVKQKKYPKNYKKGQIYAWKSQSTTNSTNRNEKNKETDEKINKQVNKNGNNRQHTKIGI